MYMHKSLLTTFIGSHLCASPCVCVIVVVGFEVDSKLKVSVRIWMFCVRLNCCAYTMMLIRAVEILVLVIVMGTVNRNGA